MTFRSLINSTLKCLLTLKSFVTASALSSFWEWQTIFINGQRRILLGVWHQPFKLVSKFASSCKKKVFSCNITKRFQWVCRVTNGLLVIVWSLLCLLPSLIESGRLTVLRKSKQLTLECPAVQSVVSLNQSCLVKVIKHPFSLSNS